MGDENAWWQSFYFFEYVISDKMWFSQDESQNYEYFNRKALQPQFRAVFRNTLKRRTLKLYEKKHFDLIEMF